MHICTTDETSPASQPVLVSNGVVGLRIPRHTLTGGWCTVSGFVGRPHPAETQGWTRAPYPLALDIHVGRHKLSQQPERLQFIEQRYDFASGELTTRLRFGADEAVLDLDVLTFASRTHPHVVVQRVSVRSARPVALELLTRIEPGDGSVLFDDARRGSPRMFDAAWLIESPGHTSRLGVALISRIAESDAVCGGGRYHLELEPGRCVEIEQVAALVPDVAHPEPDRQAIRLAYHAMQRGVARIVRENRAAWQHLWLGRPVIDGPTEAQRAADAAFFYLHSNVHPSMPANTGLLGLGLWRNYHMFRGHAFWDIDTFALPGLNLTDPAAARRVLELRHEQLEPARRNARMNGYAGAMYPWEAGTHGAEVTGIGWAKVFIEHHISLDVANAMLAHVDSTGDEQFARDIAWPVVREVADWLCSRVVLTDRGYEIRNVTGIDEGRPHVDNNAWTNGSGIALLDGARRLATALKHDAPSRWEDVARRMYLPIQDGVLLKHDDQQDEPGLCPDPLALIFPLQWTMNRRLQQKTLRYFLDRREGYIGYPMLSPPMFVWACRLGDRELAATLFERGVRDFVFGPFDEIAEFGRGFPGGERQQVGPYLAHCGTVMSGLLLGLPRLNPAAGSGADWGTDPVTLPEGWRSITAERLHVRGEAVRLEVEHGQPARLEPLYRSSEEADRSRATSSPPSTTPPPPFVAVELNTPARSARSVHD